MRACAVASAAAQLADTAIDAVSPTSVILTAVAVALELDPPQHPLRCLSPDLGRAPPSAAV